MRRLAVVMCVALALCGMIAEGVPAPRRTSKNVRKERTATSRRIESTRRQMRVTREETARELRRLESLEGELADLNARISTLRRRSDSISTQVRLVADSVAATEARVESLRGSYANALRAIRRQRQTASSAAFIFSSESFDQALRRVRYLRELGRWQVEKAATLRTEAEALTQVKIRLDSTRTRLAGTLSGLAAARKRAEAKKKASDEVVASLRKQSRNLDQVLRDDQALLKKLDSELNRIIEEEAREAAAEEARRKKAAEEARRKAAAEEEARRKAQEKAQKDGAKPTKPTKSDKSDKSGKSDRPATPVKPAKSEVEFTPAPGASFAEAKGKLPLPLDALSTVTRGFGRQAHEHLSKIQVENNGIDFETVPGASARSVFAGVVSRVIVMEGYHNVVLVRHGEYLTVYAGIADLKVRKGQTVAAGDLLGTLWSDPDDGNRTRLHFEVRHEKEKLNPADWLR